VRLDHLLSKEHLPTKVGKEPALPECGGGVLNGGDTGEFFPGNGWGSSSTAIFGWCGTESWCGWEGMESTLLGPEGTTGGCLSVACPRPVEGFGSLPGMAWSRIPITVVVLVWGLWVVGWSFVENCTVDASIFVVKLSRANGGCLGTRSR
jgi:hypothetical protein